MKENHRLRKELEESRKEALEAYLPWTEKINHSLGKTVTYVEETVEEAYDSRKIW